MATWIKADDRVTVKVTYATADGRLMMSLLQPRELYWGLPHPGGAEQWVLRAVDVETNSERLVAMAAVRTWLPA